MQVPKRLIIKIPLIKNDCKQDCIIKVPAASGGGNNRKAECVPDSQKLARKKMSHLTDSCVTDDSKPDVKVKAPASCDSSKRKAENVLDPLWGITKKRTMRKKIDHGRDLHVTRNSESDMKVKVPAGGDCKKRKCGDEKKGCSEQPSLNATNVVKQSMTREEKKRLWKELLSMIDGKIPEKLRSTFKNPKLARLIEGKIKVDIDDIEDSTWLMLRRLQQSIKKAAMVVAEKTENTGARRLLPAVVVHKEEAKIKALLEKARQDSRDAMEMMDRSNMIHCNERSLREFEKLCGVPEKYNLYGDGLRGMLNSIGLSLKKDDVVEDEDAYLYEDKGIRQTESLRYGNDEENAYACSEQPSLNATNVVKQSMTWEEKTRLWKEVLSMIDGKIPEKLRRTLKNPKLAGLIEGKIKVDIDDIEDSTWLMLRRLRQSIKKGAMVVAEKTENTGRHLLPAVVVHKGWTRLDDQSSLEKAQRAAMLRSRFADTILKAKVGCDPKRFKEEKEMLERLQREEEAKIKALLEKARQDSRDAMEMMDRSNMIHCNEKSLREFEKLCGVPEKYNLYGDGFRGVLKSFGLSLKKDDVVEDEDAYLYGDKEEGEI